ncbi:MAG TPA: protein kinase, partial [Candidatus Acidoferrales bacterium]|nr:protein kinase [Candidatus Acidoferrales bacterium]
MLSAGSKLGPYEVLGPAGAGGMGEVYRARDTRLGRDVAVKVLPEAFARDAERMARLRREAQVLASLNHPNIAAIYGFEDSGATHALVMELVEGPTLSAHIKQGAIPVEEVLPIAKQICEGVEYAHERGIIHRDLKPSNVKVTPDGHVKVLDFGLAKAIEGDSSATNIENSPTLSAMATRAGIILGTAAYMSPEQAKGKAVDRRTDIWAFGCVLYEMLAGRMAFGGETATETLAAILKSEPDWSQLPSATPAQVHVLLRRCLEKDPRQRLRDMGDARIVLEECISGAPKYSSLLVAPPILLAPRPWWRGLLPWTLTAIAVTAALALFFQRKAPAVPPLKLEINVDKLMTDWSSNPQISPDGQTIAYQAGNDLFVRNLDQLNPRKLYSFATPGHVMFWSPGSESIAFADQGKLFRIPAGGGPSTQICDLPEAILGGAWAEDGEISVSSWRGDMYEVPAQGGDVKRRGLLAPQTEVDFHEVSLLPNGLGLAYIVHEVSGVARLDALSRGTHKTMFSRKGWWLGTPVYSPPGEILFEKTSTNDPRPSIWAILFSKSKLEATGEPFLVTGQGMSPSVSREGTLIYEVPDPPEQAQMIWVSRNGKVVGSVGEAQPGLAFPKISPEGKRVAIAAVTPSGVEDLWVYDMARGVRTQLLPASGERYGFQPSWTSDGSHIVFSAINDIREELFLEAADGSGVLRDLMPGGAPQMSERGDYLAYTREKSAAASSEAGSTQVCYVAFNAAKFQSEGQPVCLANTSATDNSLRISPDEHYAAYTAEEGGQIQIFITGLPGGGGRWQVSVDGGQSPVWSHHGNELYYIAHNSMMEVKVATGSRQLSAPVNLFSLEGLHPAFPQFLGGSIFDISRDDQRFLIVQCGRNTARKNRRGSELV